METSHPVLCQAFLDFLHEPDLQKRLQDEIDSQFEPFHVITLQDRYCTRMHEISHTNSVQTFAHSIAHWVICYSNKVYTFIALS